MFTLDRHPRLTELRLFGALWLPLFLLILSVVFGARRGNWALFAALLGIAALSGLVAWLRPSLLRRLYVGLMIAVFPIGWVVSHLILALVFYGVVTPVGLLRRVLGKDPLAKRGDPGATTYWRAAGRPSDKDSVERYFRQY